MTDSTNADADVSADEPAKESRTDGGKSAANLGSDGSNYAPPRHNEFDWRGWTLVGMTIFAFLIVPAAILYVPQAQNLISRVGFSWRQAYLTLPMLSATLLGATAIWAAVTSRRSSE
ncbi:hypothetical protein ACFQJ7_12415 [Halovenus rubra]|uniref:Uncharacterized protein n=2 Tax=Halovenus rubra TaxID=869890 RepID=A0ACC7DZR7_9EURY|nr:hypothetical protein [Halovenus rubra]